MTPGALLEIFVLGLANLRRNKLRSFLTMLGMIFGVGSVIAMLSVGAGARAEILDRIGQLGIRNIIVNSLKPPEAKKLETQEVNVDRYGLTFADEDMIRTVCPNLERVLPVNIVRKPVWYGSTRVDASVRGVLPEHQRMFHLVVGRGRGFNAIDEAAEEKVCLVRKSLVRELGAMRDALGLTVRIGGFPFEIVGVLEDEQFASPTRKALALDDRSHEVYMPYSTSMRTFGTATFVRKGGSEERSVVELDQLIVTATSADLVYPTARTLAAILGRSHGRQDFEIVIPLELLEQSERTQAVFSIVMVLIAAISLVVGGIGIANIMLATITERTREIGVRRALGATRGDILAQFLTETIAIGLVGGLFGCLFGVVAIEVLIRFTRWNALIEPHYVVVSLGISGAVAVLSGIYPARRAAWLDPITALRYE